ncbi:MAG TPA: ribosome silencing factor, partial [Arenicellales bacterium]|nr:ribosome silencing factor [Arenicellales bacterium]
SSRHVLALSEAVREVTRGVGLRPLGTEGESESDWVLLDYGDVIVQLMLPTTRAFYDLEGLWNDRLGEKLKSAREGQTDP